MSLEIVEYPLTEIEARFNNGQMAGYSEKSPPKYIDCGDKRKLSQVHEYARNDIPARFFGGSAGLALVALNAVAIQKEQGETEIKKILSDYETGVLGLAARISDTAYRTSGTSIHVHSAESIERHDRSMNPSINDDVGCALMANYGLVMENATSKKGTAISRELESYRGANDFSNVSQATKATAVVSKCMGGKNARVERSTMIKVLGDQSHHTPFAMLTGEGGVNDNTAIIHDLAGYRSAADGKNYEHSVPLGELILPKVLPELDLDKSALRDSSIALGGGTQVTLGINRAFVIPPHH